MNLNNKRKSYIHNMNKQIILTKEQRGGISQNTTFVGREEGQRVREELALNQKDYDEYRYEIIMPEGTTSPEPSFYLGLLFDSVKKLGWDKYAQKYRFNLDNLADSQRGVIRAGLDECEKQAKKDLLYR